MMTPWTRNCTLKKEEVRETLIIVLAILLLMALLKWFRYYCALRGLMYHYGKKYNYVPDGERMKEITSQAMRRVIDDFFRLKS